MGMFDVFWRKKETACRMSQRELLEFTARMEAAGVSLREEADKGAAMFAVAKLGHSVAKNAHIVENRENYTVSMEGDFILVTFRLGARLR